MLTVLIVPEGQLVSALATLSHPDQPAVRTLAARVRRLQERMNRAAQAAEPYLKADNEKYFKVSYIFYSFITALQMLLYLRSMFTL